MQIITTPTPLNQLWRSREIEFEEMMKIVVDIEKEILAVDGEMHADLEQLLLEAGSLQQELWGANVYLHRDGDDFLEFTSFINIRPSQGNRSMEVMDEKVRHKMVIIVKKLLV